ncbi:MAG: Holliday junction resolvase RuvX [Cyanobacteria bacterium P01_H01_bin.74]
MTENPNEAIPKEFENKNKNKNEDENHPRILAIDPGHKRVGLAISDPLGMFPVPLETLSVSSKLVSTIAAICKDYTVKTLLVGLPLHLSGQESPSSLMARELADALEKETGLPVKLIDERMTSKLAENHLKAQGVRASKSRKKGLVDQLAAMQILEDYLRTIA